MAAGYVIVEMKVTDPERYKEYMAAAPAIIVAQGGEYVVRGGKLETLEGDWQPARLAVLKFPSYPAAKKWYETARTVKFAASAPERYRVFEYGAGRGCAGRLNPTSEQQHMSSIVDLIGREILDSRGNPTVECRRGARSPALWAVPRCRRAPPPDRARPWSCVTATEGATGQGRAEGGREHVNDRDPRGGDGPGGAGAGLS